MLKHILVPLDGSRLAEAALPAAARLAEVFGAVVTLLHVIERNAPQVIHGDRHLTNPEEAHQYLLDLAQKAFPKKIRVEQHVHTSEVDDVARSIVDHAIEYAPDLIVMCRHGRGGVRDILVGSIAQQVIAGGATPVLLIHPGNREPFLFSCATVLVPIDTRPEHDQGLRFAVNLAASCSGSIELLTVIPTLGTLGGPQAATGRMLPGAMAALLDMNVQEAENYLETQAKKYTGYNVPIALTVLRGDPVPTILDYARQIRADLMVLGTHGKTGTEAFWAGSVAPKLATGTAIPLVFVPVRSSSHSER
jgi:nucleotide-binding universal stress UspA family protein